MNTDRLVEYVDGWVEFRARGVHPEKLINLALSAGIGVWNVTRVGPTIVGRARSRHFKRLRPLARQAKVRLKILKRGGLPFTYRTLKRRWSLVVMVIGMILVCVYLSTFVWFIDVVGNDTLPEQAVRSIAEEYGLRVGVARNLVDKEKIRRGLVIEESLIAWATVEIRGTRAVVQIVERTPETAHQWLQLPGDIVAARDGLVEKLVVINGYSVVREGQAVMRGEVLIDGGDGRARGMVRGHVWYEGYAEAKTVRWQEIPTGRSVRRVTLKIASWEILLRGRASEEFSGTVVEEERRTLVRWRNNKATVEVITEHVAEVELLAQQITWDQAVREAVYQAMVQAYRLMHEGARVVETRIDTIRPGPEVAGARVTVTVSEEIGRFVPSAPYRDEGG